MSVIVRRRPVAERRAGHLEIRKIESCCRRPGALARRARELPARGPDTVRSRAAPPVVEREAAASARGLGERGRSLGG